MVSERHPAKRRVLPCARQSAGAAGCDFTLIRMARSGASEMVVHSTNGDRGFKDYAVCSRSDGGQDSFRRGIPGCGPYTSGKDRLPFSSFTLNHS